MVASEEFLRFAFSDAEGYEDVYLAGLRNRDYNILLRDYSYLQYSISKEHHVRFAYYPNPFLGNSQSAMSELSDLRIYVDEGAMTTEEYLLQVAELRNSQHPPLFRYENAPDQYEELVHPCSHFHLGHHSDNRWQLQRTLTPLAFTILVARHFYPSTWHQEEDIVLFEKQQAPDAFYEEAKLDCRILGDELFSVNEAKLFFFG